MPVVRADAGRLGARVGGCSRLPADRVEPGVEAREQGPPGEVAVGRADVDAAQEGDQTALGVVEAEVTGRAEARAGGLAQGGVDPADLGARGEQCELLERARGEQLAVDGRIVGAVDEGGEELQAALEGGGRAGAPGRRGGLDPREGLARGGRGDPDLAQRPHRGRELEAASAETSP